jgi:spermidine/putrescine transport system ATP-binding protein
MKKDKNYSSIVQLTDLQKCYGAIKAVDGVTINIGKGEFFSLLGPSGCGKTTLLRLIAGFEKPENGQIIIDDKQMTLVEPNLRPTNMVFQSYAIFPHLNVEENVGYGLKRRKISNKEKIKLVDEMLTLVGLEGLNKRAASALSGGQRQRVALARALILKPKVLLLDEPLSALDKKLREQMQVELRELQRAVGITFILVTHDQEEALTMSDRVAVMFDGKVAQLASPKKLYEKPKSKRVASFIGNMNFFKAEVVSFRKDNIMLNSKALGKLILASTQIPKELTSDSVELGIRPELLEINEKKSGNFQNLAEAHITEVSFFGESTQYKVKFSPCNEIYTISEKNSYGRIDRHVGDNITVSWNPSSFVGFL